MAYSKNQTNTEHPSRTIVKMVQSAQQTGIWPRVMLLCGKEDFLVDWSKGLLKGKLLSPATAALDCSVFSEGGLDPYEIIAACETVPMMSERKLVIVEGTDIFSAQSPKDMTAAQAGELAEYIPKLPESTLLLFTCGKPNKTKAIYKAVAKCGIIYDFTPLDDATLSGWMAKRLKAAGLAAAPSDLIAFAKACGYGDPERSYTLHNLENDLKKAIAAAEKQVLTLSDLMDSAAPQAELNAFRLLDSAFSGRKNDAFSILGATIDTQQPSKEVGSILSFLGLLCSQLEIMVEARERQSEGQRFFQIQSEMGTNEYRLRKAMAACEKRSVQELRQSLDNAYQVEKDIKNGVIEPRLAMELFISEL